VNEFGDEVRRLLSERGISLRQAARLAHYDPSYLSKVLSGTKPGSPELAAALDEILGADGVLTALASGGQDHDDARALGWAAANPRHIDQAAVDALAGLLASQRRAEDCLGSKAMLRPSAAQMTTIENLVREARGPVRPRLVHVAGQWAQFLGWLYTSTGDHGNGGAWLRQALGWAVEAGDVNLIAEVLSFQGHAAYVASQPGPVVGLSQAARRDAGAYPGQLAISSAQEAKGRAMTGDVRDVDRLLDEADELAGRARERPADAPPWLYYHTDGFFDLQRGEAYAWLAADQHYRARGAAALTLGYAALPASARESEWGAEYLVRLAAIHARGGDLEQACAVALTAAVIGRRLSSDPLTGQLQRLRASMARRWPHDQHVAELADALR
jgi:transcriptional regulator with XRE-family HTH domain